MNMTVTFLFLGSFCAFMISDMVYIFRATSMEESVLQKDESINGFHFLYSIHGFWDGYIFKHITILDATNITLKKTHIIVEGNVDILTQRIGKNKFHIKKSENKKFKKVKLPICNKLSIMEGLHEL